jgi:carbon-monoxide dehydrogenase large subunit
MSAFVLGVPEHKVRVVGPDVGGGFGSKIFHYTEEALLTWASKEIGRPIKWTAERHESFLMDAHGRDHITKAEMGFDKEGKIVGLRVKTLANLGSYLSTFSTCVPTYLHGTLLQGLYTTPKINVDVTAVFTNTAPVDAYRGAGRPEATYLLERLVDLGALEMGIDPTELRFKNFIPPFDGVNQPGYQTQVALQYDSGNYEGVLTKGLEMLGYSNFRKEQKEASQNGKLLGVGFSTYIEACGLAPSSVAGALGARAG